jgi:membrane dipeptidase
VTGATTPAPLLWEQHCCLPLSRTARLGELARYDRPGGAYVSVNAGFYQQSAADVDDLLAYFRAEVERHPTLSLARSVADVDAAAAGNRTVVAFDLEDSAPLEGDTDRIRHFYDLGVRTMLPTYNRRNAAGGGCLDETDTGLTGYGRRIVEVMNDVGMVVDGSHCGPRTGLDLSEVSAQPMVYSHSCLRAVHDHPRNITDEQALACARGGGVIGVAGVRHLIGTEGPLLDGMLRHVRHLFDLVGPEHIGLATDYVFDQEGLLANIAAFPDRYPPVWPPRGPGSYLAPEGLLRAQDALALAGLSEAEVAGILGGNFRRVAAAVWR